MWMALLVGVLASACFFSQRGMYWFTNFDDEYNFESVHEWSAGWIWHEGEVLGVYEPVANTVKLLLFRVASGTQLHAIAVKSLSCVLQFVNSAFCFAATKSALGEFGVSSCACAIACFFVCTHPLRVEVVSWCSAMPYLLATSWLYVFLFLYTTGRGCNSSALLCFSAVAYILAILCKATAVPGILLAYAWETRHFRRSALAKTALSHYMAAARKCLEVCLKRWCLALCAALAALTLIRIRLASLNGRSTAHNLQVSLTNEQVFLRATHMPLAYLVQTIWPYGKCSKSKHRLTCCDFLPSLSALGSCFPGYKICPAET
jgi:hypothetical protein